MASKTKTARMLRALCAVAAAGALALCLGGCNRDTTVTEIADTLFGEADPWRDQVQGTTDGAQTDAGAASTDASGQGDAAQTEPTYTDATTTTDPAATDQQEQTADPTAADYIFPQSATTALTDSDIAGLDAWTLSLGRNEIYARHGYIFTTPEIASYFEGKAWYVPQYAADQFDESVLSSVEQQNIAFLQDKENQLGA